MGSVVLPHLHTAWHVDQAILSEEDRLVVRLIHPIYSRASDIANTEYPIGHPIRSRP